MHTMNTAFDILVIVLSCLLGIFLILSIVVAVLMWRLVASLRAIVAKAEQLADSAEAISETLRQHATALNVAKMVAHFVSSMSGSKRRRDK